MQVGPLGLSERNASAQIEPVAAFVESAAHVTVGKFRETRARYLWQRTIP
jgi:hypothetical protein